MKRVDDDVSHMNSRLVNTRGQVLKSIEAMMDRVSQVVHLSNLNPIISNELIEVIRH